MYGHANKPNVKTGDVVVKGQTIALWEAPALTGPTFEVRVNGKTTDPLVLPDSGAPAWCVNEDMLD